MIIVSIQWSSVLFVADYRIDELARQAGTTVRNVRVYQDRGLLAPPRRDGRVGIYTDAHLARLRLIGQLLRRGYTFANISELLTVWERGGDIADILDLESAVGDPWTDDMPAYITPEELSELFGDEVSEVSVARASRLGLLEPDGDRYRVPGPRMLQAGAELVSIGMPLTAVLDLAERLGRRVDAIAEDLVQTVTRHILATHAPDGMLRGEEIAEVAAIARRMRPLARMAVESQLARSMTRHVQDAMGEHFAEVLEHLVREKASGT
jgi:DNA-binding transcriptional MerR regulator